jgi:hypothetical protein
MLPTHALASWEGFLIEQVIVPMGRGIYALAASTLASPESLLEALLRPDRFLRRT